MLGNVLEAGAKYKAYTAGGAIPYGAPVRLSGGKVHKANGTDVIIGVCIKTENDESTATSVAENHTAHICTSGVVEMKMTANLGLTRTVQFNITSDTFAASGTGVLVGATLLRRVETNTVAVRITGALWLYIAPAGG